MSLLISLAVLTGGHLALGQTVDVPVWKLDDGIEFYGLTNSWYSNHRKKTNRWETSKIDWKDQSYDASWKRISLEFSGHKNDGNRLAKYAMAYKKSKSYGTLVEYAIATWHCCSPNGAAASYFDATGDMKVPAGVFQELFRRWPKQVSPTEVRIMLLLDWNTCGNSTTAFGRIASELDKHGRLTTDVALAALSVPIRNFLYLGKDLEVSQTAVKKVQSIFKQEPTQSVRMALFFATMCDAKAKKQKSLFTSASGYYQSVLDELKSGDVYDKRCSVNGKRSLEYWSTTLFGELYSVR